MYSLHILICVIVGEATVLKIDTHLRHVKRSIYEAKSQWKNIGRSLDLSEGTINSIKDPDNGECIHIVLTHWIQTGTATIHGLLEALEDPTVKRNDIANNIRALTGKQRARVGL